MKETAKYSKKIVFICYDVCRVYLSKLLLFSVKIILVALETMVSRQKSRERANENKFNG